jgi:hypothetical protein
MGLAIDRERFELVDYLRFEERLEECLRALRHRAIRPPCANGPAHRFR